MTRKQKKMRARILAAAVLLLAVLALYAVSWRVSVAWYGKYKK